MLWSDASWNSNFQNKSLLHKIKIKIKVVLNCSLFPFYAGSGFNGAFQRASCRQDSKPPCATRCKAFLKDLPLLLRSIKPDPLDAWGAQSKLEVEKEEEEARLIRSASPPSCSAPRPKSGRKKKKKKMETEKEDI